MKRSAASSASFKHNDENESEMIKKASHSSGSSCKKCRTRNCSSEDYRAEGHNKAAKKVNVLRTISTHFIKVLNFNPYCLDIQSDKYDGCLSGKISEWVKQMDEQKKKEKFKPSEAILTLSFLRNFKTACDSNCVHEGEAMWLL